MFFGNQSKLKVAILIASATSVMMMFQNCGQSGSIVDLEAANKINGVTLIGESGIQINNGALYTRSTDVMLQLRADGAEEMMLSHSADCDSGQAWDQFTENKPWILDSDNKAVTVYARYKKRGVPESDCISAAITHDNIKPTISVSQKAPLYTNASSVTVQFSATDNGSGLDKVVCTPKNGADTSCENSYVFSNLGAEGSYDVTLKAVDKAGNVSDNLKESLIVDRTDPVITINGPQGASANPSASFEISAVDNNGIGNVQCRLSPLESSFKDCRALRINYSALVSNTYTFEVRATDVAGNSTVATRSLQIDLTVPSVTITQAPAAISNQTTASFSFTGTNGTQAISTFRCGLNTAPSVSCSSPLNHANLTDGSYTFQVLGVNALAVESSPQSHTFVVDTLPPTVRIASSPSDRVNSRTANITIDAADSNGIRSIECSLNGAAYQDCSSRSMTYTLLADGNYSFTARATDNAGNSSITAAVTWIVDTGPESEIIANMAANPIRENTTGTLNIRLVEVTNATYSCVTVNGTQTVAAGNISANESSVTFNVTTDTACTIQGLNKVGAIISRVVNAEVSCGNRLKENGRCTEFNCRSVQILTVIDPNRLSVPARSAAGICYAIKLFDAIANSRSNLTTRIETEVVSRNHDTGSGTRNPYILGKTNLNFILGGPRIVKLAGGLSTTAPILVDNYVMVGLYPQAATAVPSHYAAYGTQDSTVNSSSKHILYRDAQIGLTPFGPSGTATVSPLEIVREADTNLNYMLDIRALDCGGSREMSDIYLLFQ